MIPAGAGAAGRLAPAKVNLWLHVGPLRSDGYHPIDSLIVFASIGDRLSLRRGEDASLVVEGPFAGGLGGANLVDAARAALARAYPGRVSGFRLALDKHLPVAAGLGGGSADAAAALLLMRDALNLPATDADLAALAAAFGSDIPACLAGRPVIARGRGEQLAQAPAFPDMNAVLVNPGVAVPTAGVFRAFDEEGSAPGSGPPAWPVAIPDAASLVGYLRRTRNDLESPARRLHPPIAETLRLLAAAPETLLARMSGSGATCFALCDGKAPAGGLARRIAAVRPDWWVRPCVFEGAPRMPAHGREETREPAASPFVDEPSGASPDAHPRRSTQTPFA